MKHNRLAWCLGLSAALAAPAALADNVTIYGVADAALAYAKSDDATFTGFIRDGGLAGNRLGFKGSEDLGNGLSLIFTLEQGFLLGNGGEHRAGRAFSRQSWAGLKGSFGTATLGYQYAPGYLIPYKYQIMQGAPFLAPRSTLAFGGGYTISPGSGARWDNAMRYAGTFGAVGVQAIYAFHATQSDDGTTDRADDDRFGLGATYDAGPVGVGVVYHNVGSGSDADDTRELLVGGSVDLGMVKLVGTWSRKDADGDTAADNTLLSAGLIAPVGGVGQVHLGAAKLNPRGDDNNARAISLGYLHTVSKRTKVYAVLNRLSFDDGVTYTGNPGALSTVGSAGESTHAVIAGISHKF